MRFIDVSIHEIESLDWCNLVTAIIGTTSTEQKPIIRPQSVFQILVYLCSMALTLTALCP